MLTSLILAGWMIAAAPQTPVRAEVRPYRNAPAIWINGKPEFAYAFLPCAGDVGKYYQQFAEQGVRFFTQGSDLGNRPDGFNGAACDNGFAVVVKCQPQALSLPRVSVTAPSWWLERHPDERVVFDDGSLGPQSMFSQAWLEDACRWVEEYARHVRQSAYASHVIGMHICSGVTDEWQSWGLWDEGSGERRGDFSKPAIAAWRAYLRGKYKTQKALCAAWGRDISFESAEMPSRARREADFGPLRTPPEQQDIIDFYDFYWRGTTKAITQLAAAAKRGGGRDFLVAYFYGYLLQYGGRSQESQHLGLREAIDCPDIDVLVSPASYSGRGPGGTSTFMSLTESIVKRGKFWWDEADNRTHLAKSDLGRAADLQETLNVLKREYAHVLTKQAGLWWMDQQGGWFDDPVILDLFRQQREFGETNPGAWRPKAEVALFVDAKSCYRQPPDSAFLFHNLNVLASEFPRLGAPYDAFLLDDLPAASEYKVYVFPNAIDLTDKERRAIRALQRKGKTLIFAGPAGEGRRKGSSLHVDRALSDKLLGVDASSPYPVTKQTGRGKLIWFSEKITLDDIRAAARDAGVHLFSESDDALYAGNGMIALHARDAGPKTLHFPNPVRLKELFCDTPFTWSGTRLDFDMKPSETRCFAVK